VKRKNPGAAVAAPGVQGQQPNQNAAAFAVAQAAALTVSLHRRREAPPGFAGYALSRLCRPANYAWRRSTLRTVRACRWHGVSDLCGCRPPPGWSARTDLTDIHRITGRALAWAV